MRLHENEKLFIQSVRFTGTAKRIKEIYIERILDHLCLYQFFNSGQRNMLFLKENSFIEVLWNLLSRFSWGYRYGRSKRRWIRKHLKERLRSPFQINRKHASRNWRYRASRINLGWFANSNILSQKLFKGNYDRCAIFIVLEVTLVGSTSHILPGKSFFHLTNDVGNGSSRKWRKNKLNAFLKFVFSTHNAPSAKDHESLVRFFTYETAMKIEAKNSSLLWI